MQRLKKGSLDDDPFFCDHRFPPAVPADPINTSIICLSAPGGYRLDFGNNPDLELERQNFCTHPGDFKKYSTRPHRCEAAAAGETGRTRNAAQN
jgi:hypothetical protein